MSGFCDCANPKPRPAGVGKVVCVHCHRKVFAQKKGEADGAEAQPRCWWDVTSIA